MDKLKSVLNYVKKYGFWFLLGTIVVAVLGCWWLATSSVAADVKDKRTKIDESFTKVQSIAGNLQHPTQKYIESLEKEQEKLKQKVLDSWKALYEEQQKKNPWPPVLGNEFLDAIKNLKSNEEIPYKLRGRYWNFIKEYFPRLKEVVDWRHPKEDPAAAADANLGAAAEPKKVEMVGVVDWDSNDIAKLEKDFDWNATPSDKKVKLKQEDLWVMLSLLRVIKNTNEGVADHSKAVIKRIDSLDIGPYAVRAWREAEGQVFRGGAAAAATGAPGEAVPPPPAGAPGQNEDELLLVDRYVDDNGAPLAAGTNPPNQEFKMMPIRMKIYIDQRKIAKLLAQCANSEMPIEVRRVRIKPGEGEVVDFGGGVPGSVPSGGAPGGGMPGGGIMAGEMRGPGGYGPMGMPGMAHGGPPGGGYGPMGGMRGFGEGMGGFERGPGFNEMPGTAAAWEKSPMDIPLEIQGIICIYNPPDITKLGKGGAGETPPVETPGATPANPVAPPAEAATPTAPPVNAPPAATNNPPVAPAK
ncbi:MAG: hypothetical protein IT426_03985 [Pirellulales bacterium]|nr:hypothetical protein [Pirellulales bacterium]